MKIYKLLIKTIFLFLFFLSCKEKEDLIITPPSNQNINYTNKTVGINDIPEIASFIKEQTRGTYRYNIKDISTNRNEGDIILGELVTEDIKQTTNPNNLSNYTFKLNKNQTDTELSFLKLVVKETSTGLFSFIIKVKPDSTWLENSTQELNMYNFSGYLLFYKPSGEYVFKQQFSNGLKTQLTYSAPCNPNTDQGDTDANNSGGGGIENVPDSNVPSDFGDFGSVGGTGSVYSGSGIMVGCTCNFAPHLFSDCGCTPIRLYVIAFKSAFANPCDGCSGQNDCEFGYDQDCNCLPNPNDTTNENLVIDLDLIKIPTVIHRLNSLLTNGLTSNQINWINQSQNNANQAQAVADFLDANNTPEGQVVGHDILNTMSDINLTQDQQLTEVINELNNYYTLLGPNLESDLYATEVLRISNWIKVHGKPELGNYIDSFVPDFPNMEHGDVLDIYRLTCATQSKIQAQIFFAILTTIAKTVRPFVEFAVIDATLGLAIPILAKIPLSFVTRGARLEAMVREVGLMGIQGTSNSIRIVTTTSPLAKTEELFATLTKDATTTTTYSNGTIVAFFNNGNKIVFRTQSSSGFPATLELTFSEIWTQTRIVKFQ